MADAEQTHVAPSRRFSPICLTTPIDGATILTYQGELLAVGAIVKIDGGSTGGGRLAATKTLAAYGTAIKVSADGMVEAFVRSDDGQPESVFEF